ncbi:hypothetical protein [Candidatus Oscillochloris fontis]|uniref:hypothetical protein n=1 Tax=Candidatus Oscillochloris fontis TaxID=2496868 RepID=UPI00101CFC9C|nr:hypothetical protein [Candidatus Oscillochloris fontis]
MDDAYGYEERIDGSDGPQIVTSGDYLCVQHEGRLRYVYRRVVPGGALPQGSHTSYGGEIYSLAWIEDDD